MTDETAFTFEDLRAAIAEQRAGATVPTRGRDILALTDEIEALRVRVARLEGVRGIIG